jgi:AcrR family transcriptional regulator
MAPKEIVFTKEQVVNAAFDVVREQGIGALSARKVAEHLGSSTAPVYSWFSSMHELGEAVARKTHDLLLEYTRKPYTPRVDLNIGVGIVLFARDHPKLFTTVHTEGKEAYDADNELQEYLLKQLKPLSDYQNMTDEDIRTLFNKFKIFSHGLALLACSHQLPYDSDDFIIYIFWECGEELIEAAQKKTTHKDEYTFVHGLKVHKDKIQQLSQWRKKQHLATE